MHNQVTPTNHSLRDGIADQQRRTLLRDYAAISSRRPGAAVATSLRHQSPSYRDILAFEATNNTYDYDELKTEIQTGTDIRSSIVSIHRYGALGRLALLQNTYEDDSVVGEAILSQVVDWLSLEKARSYRLLLVQFYILNGAIDKARSLLEVDPGVDKGSHHHLHTDLMNPSLEEHPADHESWLKAFNRPFRKFNLYPVELRCEGQLPFNRLRSRTPNRQEPVFASPKLVSVVFTSFQPKRDDLINAVRSVLEQTWNELEVIIVDDSSGPEYQPIFEEADRLDTRVKVVSTPNNGGTYLARNLGFGIARGHYLTGHDDDDWSHPQRIEAQVAFLESNSELAGCRVHSIACDEDLLTTRLGKRTPEESNASTLMLSREVWKKVGGFLPVRKAGDTELYLRVERLTQKQVKDLPVPLTIIRKAEGSLSNAEFRTGWSHPARRSFKAAYRYWHQNASSHELQLTPGHPLELGIPYRFQISVDKTDSHFDVIYAGDWHPLGGPQRSMLEEIKALLAENKRIGVLHLEPARFMSSKERSLGDAIIELINSGQVTNVLYDDPVTTELLFLRYPPIMQFPPAEPSSISARKTIIVANQAPEEVDGSDVRYIPHEVQRHTEEAFRSEVTWAPQSNVVRERLPDKVLGPFNLPGILNLDEWYIERTRFRSVLPVVGRHSRDTAMKWPGNASKLRAAYPTDGTFDVRILGGGKTALKVLKRSTVPGSWSVYSKDQMSPQTFLGTIDFYVFFQHQNAVEAFGRSILEAIASGIVVILEEKFRSTFGEAAIYGTPEDVVNIVREFHQNRSKYNAQVSKSRSYLQEHFSYGSYSHRIETLLKELNEAAI